MWALLYAQDGSTRRNVLLARAPAAPQFVEPRSGGPAVRDVIGIASFEEEEVAARLRELALPEDAPLSVIAVELLPGDHLLQRSQQLLEHEVFFTVDIPEVASEPFSAVSVRSDPLGAELGGLQSRRILRCSPLTPVARAC